MIKKDLQLLHQNHLIEESDFKYLINCFAQIDILKLQIKEKGDKYKDIIKQLKNPTFDVSDSIIGE